MEILEEAGHEIGDIAQAVVNIFSYTIDEIVTSLHDLGHDITTIAETTSTVLDAGAMKLPLLSREPVLPLNMR